MTSISGVGTSMQMLQQLMNTLKSADTDADGVVSFEEFSNAISTDGDGNTIEAPEGAASLEQMFSDIDADGDGYLSESEISSFEPPEPFSLESASGSLLSGDTLSTLLASMSEDEISTFFEEADTDGDGTLSAEELQVAIASLVEEAVETDSSEATDEETVDGAGAPPPPPPPSAEEEESVATVFDVLDTNEDGSVSLEELLAAQGDSDLSAELDQAFRTSLFGYAMISAQEQTVAA